MSPFLAVIARDLRLARRQGTDIAMTLAFFVVVVALFPLGLGPTPELLARIAPAVLWVTALLAAMLSFDRLFQQDSEDGGLEQLALSGLPLSLLALAKAVAHWLTTGLPMLVLAPLLAVSLNLASDAYWTLVATLALGTPVVSLFGTVGAALVVGARRAGVLVALIVLPLLIPVLIFAVSAIEAASAGLTIRVHLLFLGAILAASIPLAPLAAGAALRQALD
ncbi:MULTISPECIES: heme exporter protein CcmB [Thalassobaculum]|uniref:Heme exporter protein B n=1 Tax=Thalassobaculum litoreum DSM 18839 TaxID=1123362 RepID=A0A8G2EVY5_9PROT|nr:MULTISPECIES: heme exporter protein CcmB [Thalassobaculum]SDF53070.1 heme exporter protein B [Thalassobaculum litoreum DSM 18839]